MAEDLIDHYESYKPETLRYLEREFDRLEDDCYLDHAGATLYSKTQIENISKDLRSTVYGNPHSLGGSSKQTLDLIEQTRFRVLDHFNTNSDEYSLIFTSSATDSLKLVSEAFDFSENGHFVYLQDNHTSVLGMRDVVSRRGAQVSCLTHDEAFRIFRGDQGERTSADIVEDRNSLFVFPAQCNFSGFKYPLSWIEKTREQKSLDRFLKDSRSNWFILLDAASYVGSNILDLSINRPDFVCLSFYKMFGYPTGLGALLVKNSAQEVLRKVYYGGGTVEISLSSEMFHSKRPVLHERFEDGTLPFLSIISLSHGFSAVDNIGWQNISRHVFYLAKYLHDSLLKLHHGNGKPLAILYTDSDYEDVNWQGGIVTFNLLRSNGEHVGFVEFLNMANLHKIHLRTGCFCNPGACQRHLGLSNDNLRENFNAGHVCGDERDLVNGKPTGAVRISFGYMSKVSDVERLLSVIKICFLDGVQVRKIPDWWEGRKMKLREKYDDEGYVGENFDNGTENLSIRIAESGDETSDDILEKEKGLESEVKRNGNDGRTPVILTRLFIYPVKSCAAYEIHDSWIIGDKGLIHDREWMITTASGACLTQKQDIKLSLIRPSISQSENVMRLNYPGMPSIDVPLEMRRNGNGVNISSTTICRSKICGHKVEGIDCGTDVSEWLSLALGKPGLRLVRENGESKKTKSSGLSFSSQAQYLLINEGSILWLGEKIPPNSGCDKKTILHRFRGNLIIAGCKPFRETNWTSVKIGETKFRVDGQCTRCQMICIDQNTGKKTVEPLRTLAEEFHGKLRFGIYLSRDGDKNSVINIGDEVIYQ